MSGSWLRNRVHFWLMTVIAGILLSGCGSQYLVLNPKGPVAETQYNLIIISVVLIGIVIIPVLALTAFIVYRYRDTPDNKASYKPEWAHNTKLEIIWWGIPIIIIAILGYFTVRDTYVLAEPPTKDVKPITIQVTSLDWKWMFTYPEQKVATVNYVQIPVGVPVQFKLTADAPINSFWVPQLAGQIYTLPGKETKLWMQADEPGEYDGMGANFSGEGFAKMQFTVVAKPQDEFDKWVQRVINTTPAMTRQDYAKLREPGLSERLTYSSFPDGLFEEIVRKNSEGHDDKQPAAEQQESGQPTDGGANSNQQMNQPMPEMSKTN